MRDRGILIINGAFLFAALTIGDSAFANGEVTEIEYSTSLSEATGIVRIIVAAFGGLIGLLGILVTVKGVFGMADVSVSLSEHKKLSMKRVSQGVVITLIGAAVLLGAVYLLPEKRTERQIKGKELMIEREPDRERMKARH
ncbi:MAG: hypothetical protein MRJ65_06300 [Candidatus Brocadiaceae bacterium]|nr:hypothetical protein [Candidatus Brocadiaceae bacterium]